jgi:hypothetical protein
MAGKKITDLTLRSSADATCNFPIDDGIQTYRITGQQIFNYVSTLPYVVKTSSASLTNTEYDGVLFIDATSNDVAITLPTVSDVTGKCCKVFIKEAGLYVASFVTSIVGYDGVLGKNSSFTIYSDGTNFYLLK